MISNAEKKRLLKILEDAPDTRFPLPQAYADPAFMACLHETIETPELIKNIDRLYGTRLSSLGSRSPLERMVDDVTGFQNSQIEQLIMFVHEFVYFRVPAKALHAYRFADLLKPEEGEGRAVNV
jgi:hypothetical protein